MSCAYVVVAGHAAILVVDCLPVVAGPARQGAARQNPKDGVVGWLGVDKARGEREGGRSSISSMVRVVDGGRRRIEI